MRAPQGGRGRDRWLQGESGGRGEGMLRVGEPWGLRLGLEQREMIDSSFLCALEASVEPLLCAGLSLISPAHPTPAGELSSCRAEGSGRRKKISVAGKLNFQAPGGGA